MEQSDVMPFVKQKIRASLGMRIQAGATIQNDDNLRNDLGFDSIDELEVIAELEKNFNIQIGLDNHLETPQDYCNIVLEKLHNIPREKEIKKGIFMWFANRKSKKDEEKSQELDVTQNEMQILQMILFNHAVNYDVLHDMIKGSFGIDVPMNKLENVQSVEALYHTMKKCKTR